MLAEIVRFEGVELIAQPSEAYEYTMDTATVAMGYGCKESSIRSHLLRHADELVEGKHFITFTSVANCNAREGEEIRPQNRNLVTEKTLWTKRGVVRLGFFIRSERAKKFRDWAEDLIVSGGISHAHDNDRLKLVNDFIKNIAVLIGSMNLSRAEQLSLLYTYSKNELGYGFEQKVDGDTAVLRTILSHDADFIHLLYESPLELIKLANDDIDEKKIRSALSDGKIPQTLLIKLFKNFTGEGQLSSKAVMQRMRCAAKSPLLMTSSNGTKFLLVKKIKEIV